MTIMASSGISDWTKQAPFSEFFACLAIIAILSTLVYIVRSTLFRSCPVHPIDHIAAFITYFAITFLMLSTITLANGDIFTFFDDLLVPILTAALLTGIALYDFHWARPT